MDTEKQNNQLPKQTSHAWRWISIGITVVLVAGGIMYIVRHRQEFSQLKNLGPLVLVEIAALLMLSRVLLGWSTQQLLIPLGTRLKFNEWLGLTIAGSLANLVAPFSAGAGFRAVYLKRVHNTAYVHFVSCFAAIAIIGLLVNSATATFVLVGLWLWGGAVYPSLTVIVVLALAGSLGLVLLPPKLPIFQNKWLRRVGAAINGWHMVARQRMLVAKVIAAMTIRILGLATAYHIAFRALGVSASWPACWTATSFSAIWFQIHITPGSLGIYEGTLAWAFTVFGIALHNGLMVALIHRCISTTIVIVLGSIYTHLLTRKMTQPPRSVGE